MKQGSNAFYPGTIFREPFRNREPFSQELYLQERFGGNVLAGTFRQERFNDKTFYTMFGVYF
jgi:hypothetical protein